MATLLVVGLGNPGAQYDQTRHNIGWMLIDLLAQRFGVTLQEEQALKGNYGEVEINGTRLALLKPLTFMNLSGQSALPAMAKLGISAESVLCAVDEIQLEVGRLKLSSGGSDGGHNGLKSMIAELESNAFRRLRLGVGPYRKESEPKGLKGFVLSRFKAEESKLLEETLALGVQAIEAWIEQGADDPAYVKAVSFANAKSRQPKLLQAKSAPEPKPEEASPQVVDAKSKPKGFWARIKALFGGTNEE